MSNPSPSCNATTNEPRVVKAGVRLCALCLAYVIAFMAPLGAAAIQAQDYRRVVDDRLSIDLRTDHYAVEFLGGWISSEDDFFRSLFARRSQLIETFYASVEFFDSPDQEHFSHVRDYRDLKGRKTSRRWGGHQILIDNIPADVGMRLRLQLLIHREERLSQVLDGLRGAAPTATALDPWLGYTAAVSGVVKQLIKADAVSVPFEWEGSIRVSEVVRQGVMQPHYIFLISPRNEKDELFYESEKLIYQDGWLRYGESPLTANSWAVLQVSRRESPDILRMSLKSSKSWAVVANKLRTVQLMDTLDSDQLDIRVRGLIDLLETELELLKQEPRFSGFDRAVALSSQAEELRARVSGFCGRKGLLGEDCPDWRLSEYARGLAPAFGLGEQLTGEIRSAGLRLAADVMIAHSRFSDAKKLLGDAIASRSTDFRAHLTLGQLLAQSGEFIRAETELEQALALQEITNQKYEGELGETLASLLEVYFRMGKVERATEIERRYRALRMGPGGLFQGVEGGSEWPATDSMWGGATPVSYERPRDTPRGQSIDAEWGLMDAPDVADPGEAAYEEVGMEEPGYEAEAVVKEPVIEEGEPPAPDS